MVVHAFVGPSLKPGQRPAERSIVWLPPVSQGDLLPLLDDPSVGVIAIVDGYFESVPAVLHKEILLAIERGVHVVGGGSMGALRAAELHPFGMIGVGRIFGDFASGRLVDDDEVAVLHGPAETGYVALSDAMVDIRATVEAALAAGAIDREGALDHVRRAKALFYKERRIPGELRAFRVEQKRLDAGAVLEHALGLAGTKAAAPSWHLQWTDVFEEVMNEERTWRARLSPLDGALLDIVRLHPRLWLELRDPLLFAGLARRGHRGVMPLPAVDLEPLRSEFLAARSVHDPETETRWLDGRQADRSMLDRHLQDGDALAWLRLHPPGWFWQAMAERVKLHADGPQLIEMAHTLLRRQSQETDREWSPEEFGTRFEVIWSEYISTVDEFPCDSMENHALRYFGWRNREEFSRAYLSVFVS